MTELRKELNVTDEVHAELLFQAHDDENIRNIWYALARLLHPWHVCDAPGTSATPLACMVRPWHVFALQ